MTEAELELLVSEHFLDVAHRVAHVEPQTCGPIALSGALQTFGLEVHGDYALSLVLCVPDCVLRTLAEGMRRGEAADTVIAVSYVSEFFNILCGRIVSSLNRSMHASARFGLPRVAPGVPESNGRTWDFYYALPSGPLLIRTIYQ